MGLVAAAQALLLVGVMWLAGWSVLGSGGRQLSCMLYSRLGLFWSGLLYITFWRQVWGGQGCGFGLCLQLLPELDDHVHVHTDPLQLPSLLYQS